ncbi:MAG: DUF1499 domain-containing protein [Chloroflexota bacterium]
MQRRLIIAAIILLFVLVLCYPLTLAAVTLGSPTPPGVGAGRIDVCPDRPNCVSSLQDEATAQRVDPLTYTNEQFSIEAEAFSEDDRTEIITARLITVLEGLPRTQVMVAQGGYIHAETRSRVFRFVDDLELQIDPASQEVQVRSAARLGQDDLGVNRRRVQAIREAFNASQ